MISVDPVASSAIMTAVSSASVPEAVKQVCFRFPGVMRASRSASSTTGRVGYSDDTCDRRSICARTAALTRVFACPTETVRIPPKKSKVLVFVRVPDPEPFPPSDDRVLVILDRRRRGLPLLSPNDLRHSEVFALVLVVLTSTPVSFQK